MSSLLEQTIDRLATKDVCQHIDYQYNHWIFFYIFVGITDAVFLFHLNIPMELYFKEHFIFVYLELITARKGTKKAIYANISPFYQFLSRLSLFGNARDSTDYEQKRRTSSWPAMTRRNIVKG